MNRHGERAIDRWESEEVDPLDLLRAIEAESTDVVDPFDLSDNG